MKILIISIVLILFLGVFFFFQRSSHSSHPAIQTIPADQFREKMDKDVALQLVDVRTALEYNRGHLKSSVNMNCLVPDFKKKFKSYDKEKPLYLYCRSGHRSAVAAQILAEEGFTEIYELEGGLVEWNKSK